MADPTRDAVASASGDPEVRDAAKSLILKALAQAETQLERGDPNARREIIRMFAGGAVKEVTNPQRSTKADEEKEIEGLMEQFHQTRRDMGLS